MELKFRARDGYNIRYDITWFEHWHQSSNEMKWVFIKWDYYEIKTTPVMQYTWLKDKNWKEIYEGDIIIDYNEQHSWYNIPLEVIITPYKTTTKEESLWYRAWERYEVIWNIYENPDLINN